MLAKRCLAPFCHARRKETFTPRRTPLARRLRAAPTVRTPARFAGIPASGRQPPGVQPLLDRRAGARAAARPPPLGRCDRRGARRADLPDRRAGAAAGTRRAARHRRGRVPRRPPAPAGLSPGHHPRRRGRRRRGAARGPRPGPHGSGRRPRRWAAVRLRLPPRPSLPAAAEVLGPSHPVARAAALEGVLRRQLEVVTSLVAVAVAGVALDGAARLGGLLAAAVSVELCL